MQVPSMGSQQNKAHDKRSSPKQQQKRHQQLWKQYYKQPETFMVVPYTKELSESLKKVCNKHGVQVYFRAGNSIRSLLVALKDNDPILKKSGVIYRYKCDRVECNEEYIRESSRTFRERFKEHQKTPFLIYVLSNITILLYCHYRNLQHSGEGGPEPH